MIVKEIMPYGKYNDRTLNCNRIYLATGFHSRFFNESFYSRTRKMSVNLPFLP
jgi:hypothetical protein